MAWGRLYLSPVKRYNRDWQITIRRYEGVCNAKESTGKESLQKYKKRWLWWWCLCDQILTPMWGAVQSQIYKELQRMKALGWIEMEREEQESRPNLNLRRPTHEKQF